MTRDLPIFQTVTLGSCGLNDFTGGRCPRAASVFGHQVQKMGDTFLWRRNLGDCLSTAWVGPWWQTRLGAVLPSGLCYHNSCGIICASQSSLENLRLLLEFGISIYYGKLLPLNILKDTFSRSLKFEDHNQLSISEVDKTLLLHYIQLLALCFTSQNSVSIYYLQASP